MQTASSAKSCFEGGSAKEDRTESEMRPLSRFPGNSDDDLNTLVQPSSGLPLHLVHRCHRLSLLRATTRQNWMKARLSLTSPTLDELCGPPLSEMNLVPGFRIFLQRRVERVSKFDSRIEVAKQGVECQHQLGNNGDSTHLLTTWTGSCIV